jgi:hypothetical protein
LLILRPDAVVDDPSSFVGDDHLPIGLLPEARTANLFELLGKANVATIIQRMNQSVGGGAAIVLRWCQFAALCFGRRGVVVAWRVIGPDRSIRKRLRQRQRGTPRKGGWRHGSLMDSWSRVPTCSLKVGKRRDLKRTQDLTVSVLLECVSLNARAHKVNQVEPWLQLLDEVFEALASLLKSLDQTRNRGQ